MDAYDIIAAVERLKRDNIDSLPDRQRIKFAMNGGVDGVYATMAWDHGQNVSAGREIARNIGVDLPAVNLVASGLDRLAQQVGVAPTLKMPYGPRDSERARRRAEKRERIVEGWDYSARLHMHYPQIGRWLPGYTFFAWTLGERKFDGGTYPYPKLRDPYDTYLGWSGPDQIPEEMAIVRKVPFDALKSVYERDDWDALEERAKAKFANHVSSSGQRGWEGVRGGIEVYEYWCGRGTYLAIPALEAVVDYMPNPLESGPAFIPAKKFSFDRPTSQYHHVFGLATMMAKMNVLGMIASEDSVFAPVDVIGELTGEVYQRGRFAMNEFEPGTRIQRGIPDMPQHLWAQIDRIERQIRIGAQYDVQQDGQSPNSFATGMGMKELQTAAANNVREYQTVIADAVERLDAKRLEWDSIMHARETKTVYVLDRGREVKEEYTPATDIGNNYRTRRVYGMMATWDDGTKIVGGLQLLQAGIIDELTLQENLHGIDDPSRINNRVAAKRAYEGQMASVEQMAAQGDPRAQMALVEIADDPQNRLSILKKFFTPQEPQMSEEEMAMAGMGGQLDLGPDASVQTVLSQMEQTGAVKGGVQTITSQRR